MGAGVLHVILHCMDHWNLSHIFNQHASDFANWFLVQDVIAKEGLYEESEIAWKEYEGAVATTLCLTDDWPKLFSVYHRQSSDPFYQAVYKTAQTIDPEYAYHL